MTDPFSLRRKDKEGGVEGSERAHVCVRTIRRRPPPPHSKSFTIYLGAFIPHFTCERRARRTDADAAVEMWEIRSQMRIAAREERFVAARTIKHGSHPAKFGSIQMLLARRAITNEETADQQHRSRIHDQIPLWPTDRSSELNAFLLLVSRLTLGEWKSKQGRPASCDPSCDCKMKWERVSEAPLAI